VVVKDGGGVEQELYFWRSDNFCVVAKDLPNPSKLISDENPESSLIYDRNGVLLYEFYSDKNRVSVPLSEIPTDLKEATLAIEDANFYKHIGLDFKVLPVVYIKLFLRKICREVRL
jgi:membrane carboxypeptidase/penicillin-binding protein